MLRRRAVRHAIILAAGNGDRFQSPTHESKLLQPLLGRPILVRTLEAARDAGVKSVTLVLGYQAERLRALAAHATPVGLTADFAFNPEWRLENGVSALAARSHVNGEPFALLMGDHVFDPAVLRRMLRTELGPDESLLAVDSRSSAPEVVAEATKVRREGSRIVAIGKDIPSFDALDTGVFICTRPLFDALDAARRDGDTTLSGGVRRLAARRLMRAFDIGEARWCDIDTTSDLADAESVLSAAPGAA